MPVDPASARDLRAAEPWLMYDSIVIGPGAQAVDDGWFDSWADLSRAADKLRWFVAARKKAPKWSTNVGGEREDFSLYFYQMGLEFAFPPGISGVDQDGVDLFVTPLLNPHLFTTYLHLEMKLAETDNVLSIPAAHAPGAVGPYASHLDGLAGPTVSPAANGQTVISNSWFFADPQSIPRQGKWTVTGNIDNPARDWFANIPGPGTKVLNIPVPGEAPRQAVLPNWSILRLWLRGYRKVQLRGARSV